MSRKVGRLRGVVADIWNMNVTKLSLYNSNNMIFRVKGLSESPTVSAASLRNHVTAFAMLNNRPWVGVTGSVGVTYFVTYCDCTSSYHYLGQTIGFSTLVFSRFSSADHTSLRSATTTFSTHIYLCTPITRFAKTLLYLKILVNIKISHIFLYTCCRSADIT